MRGGSAEVGQDGVADLGAARGEAIDGAGFGQEPLANVEVEPLHVLREVPRVEPQVGAQTQNALPGRAVETRLRTVPESQIVLALPHRQIVPAFVAGDGIGRNLVAPQAQRGQLFAHLANAVQHLVVAGNGALLGVENALLLQNERINAAMLEAPVFQLPPVVRIAHDKVDAGIVEVFAHQVERPMRLCRRIAASHVLERPVVKGLHTHRNAVHPARFQRFQQWPGDVQGMQLDREFRRGKSIQERFEVAQSRSAAPEIDGLERSRGQFPDEPSYVFGVGFDGPRRERAIRALPATERKMEIKVIQRTAI